MIKDIANYNPKFVTNEETVDYFAYMRSFSITALPVVKKK